MNIILRPHYFGGKNNNYDNTYVVLSLKSILQFNSNENIYFISNDASFIENNFINKPTNLHYYMFNELENENTLFINNNYIHLSHNQLNFEKFCIMSYFYIYNLMLKHNLDEIIVVETDVLVFCNLYDTFKQNYDICNIDALLGNKTIMCCSYIKKIYLETFCNAVLKIYSDNNIIECIKSIFNNMSEGGICDMTFNKFINDETVWDGLFMTLNQQNKKLNIQELSIILPDNSFFDDQLSKLNYNFGVFEKHNNIKNIYIINNEYFFKLNDKFIKCNSMHFQGNVKTMIKDYYNENKKQQIYFLSYCNYSNDLFNLKTKYLSKSSNKYNIDIIYLERNNNDDNYYHMKKIISYASKIKEINDKEPNSIVVCIDANDVFILDYAENIVNNFLQLNCNILFSSERHYCNQILGNNNEVINYYFNNDINSDYKSLNSGCFIGFVSKLNPFLSDLLKFYNNDDLIKSINNNNFYGKNLHYDYSKDDQCIVGYFIYLSNGLDKYNIKLDWFNKIFFNPMENNNINESIIIYDLLEKTNNYTILNFNNKNIYSQIIHISGLADKHRNKLANKIYDLL